MKKVSQSHAAIIIVNTIRALLAAGHKVTVANGTASTVKRYADMQSILEAAMRPDASAVFVPPKDEPRRRFGFFRINHFNAGCNGLGVIENVTEEVAPFVHRIA